MNDLPGNIQVSLFQQFSSFTRNVDVWCHSDKHGSDCHVTELRKDTARLNAINDFMSQWKSDKIKIKRKRLTVRRVVHDGLNGLQQGP